MSDPIEKEIARRRTFAIISHPDAGKTTLTERLLLHGGALRYAGSVTARRNEPATASDWMELERQRGISITSTVLPFDFEGHRMNLLDTPGHRDFSEDTYRVLLAVDAAVMVLDAAKGIEDQTRKLFEVCRSRRIPILTFVNKMDRPGRGPIEILDEIEAMLSLRTHATTWPLGAGEDLRGVYDRRAGEVHLFDRARVGGPRASVRVSDPRDAAVAAEMSSEDHRSFLGDIELLDSAGSAFDARAVAAGEMTPVFFGSALHDFGVELLLRGLLELAPPPGGTPSARGVVEPNDPAFSGFIFKIQGNMDPRHRDRVAFLRVSSGRFTREMSVRHPRTGRPVRLANAHRVFGREREVVDEAFPGDIVGLVGLADLRIGDTLTDDPSIRYPDFPRFPPEHFSILSNPAPSRFKAFRKGVTQLLQEGVVESFRMPGLAPGATLIGAVGPLQFEVLVYRLQSEYGVEAKLEEMPWRIVRWLGAGASHAGGTASSSEPFRVSDGHGRVVLLFRADWSLKYFAEKHLELTLLSSAPAPLR